MSISGRIAHLYVVTGFVFVLECMMGSCIAHAEYVFSREEPIGCEVRQRHTVDPEIPMPDPVCQGDRGICYAYPALHQLQFLYNSMELDRAKKEGRTPQFKELSLADILGKTHASRHLVEGSYVQVALLGVRDAADRVVAVGPDPSLDRAFRLQSSLQIARTQQLPTAGWAAFGSCRALSPHSPLTETFATLREALKSPITVHGILRERETIPKETVQIPPYDIHTALGSRDALIRKVNDLLSNPSAFPIALSFIESPGFNHAITVTGTRRVCCVVSGKLNCQNEWKIIENQGGFDQGWVNVNSLLEHHNPTTFQPGLTFITPCRVSRLGSNRLPWCASGVLIDGTKFASQDILHSIFGRSSPIEGLIHYVNAYGFRAQTADIQIYNLLNLLDHSAQSNRPEFVPILGTQLENFTPLEITKYLRENKGHFYSIYKNISRQNSYPSLEKTLPIIATLFSKVHSQDQHTALNLIASCISGLIDSTTAATGRSSPVTESMQEETLILKYTQELLKPISNRSEKRQVISKVLRHFSESRPQEKLTRRLEQLEIASGSIDPASPTRTRGETKSSLEFDEEALDLGE